MTVTYTSRVTTSRHISNFLRLLLRWKGSIYKLIWFDLLLFLVAYVTIAFSYRFSNDSVYADFFEKVVQYCAKHSNFIPLSFVLGFFVSIVMGRWWAQYKSIPWPDSVALLVSSSLQGHDDRARVMRRTIMRYVCLCQVIVFTMISPSVKKRFPNYNYLIVAGLMLENEKYIMDAFDSAFPRYPKHWMPIVWAASIVTRARRENKIRDDYAVKSIIDELNSFRGWCGFLLYYDWVSVPLVYTQVVTLATYTFFLCTVIGQQWIANPNSPTANNSINEYFPILTIMQFFFYMGWLKVAESLINPFGEDDDDFELNWMIDRNLAVSYLIVDEMHQEHPQLIKDQYWDEVFPNELPYTDESKRPVPPEASTAKLGIDLKEMHTSIIGSRASFVADMFEPNESRKGEGSPVILKVDLPTSEREESSDHMQSNPNSLNLEELIEQRNRERNDRLRNRFRSIRSSHRPTRTSRYVLTVLRPPSPDSYNEEEEQEEEGEHEPQQQSNDYNSKSEKND